MASKFRWALAELFAVLFGLSMLLAPPPAEAAAAPGPGTPAGLEARLFAMPFAEPLVPTGATTPAEDRELLGAAAAYAHRADPDDFSALTGFLAAHPHSPWRAAVQTNLGLDYLRAGYFSRALPAFEAVWSEGKGATSFRARSLVDRALGELSLLEVGLGHPKQLAALLDEVGGRKLIGPGIEMVARAGELLFTMKMHPRFMYICGPLALRAVMLTAGAKPDQVKYLFKVAAASPKGVSLAELARLAKQGKAPYAAVFRKPGERVPVPSVVQWKIGHYAAILKEAQGRFLVRDPMFGRHDLWMTRTALDAEASGYFLAPEEKLRDAGWRPVASNEAERVYGAGFGNHTGQHCCQPCPCAGLTTYGIDEQEVSLNLMDEPVGYTPQKGPAPTIVVSYNQRDLAQPSNLNFYNISPKWTINWLAYISDNPSSPGSQVTRYTGGGGLQSYSGYQNGTGVFAPEEDDGSILQLVSQNPVEYERFLKSGGSEIYAQSENVTTTSRNVFLTQIVDPQGNTLSLSYDGQGRLASLTDATGRSTTFTYGNASFPLQITQIADPFGRSAIFSYDGSGRLASITDVLGLTSTFTYDSSSVVNSLTTPYGTTQFAWGGSASNTTRFLQITDPLGHSEREETLQPAPVPFSEAVVPQGLFDPFNAYLSYRDSFHWDKHQYAVAGCTPNGGCDYNDARMTHFNHEAANLNNEWYTIESIKEPLESRVWNSYPGQSANTLGGGGSGTYDMPSQIARVLDNGATQLWQFSYNGQGQFTQKIDPIGRQADYAYAANEIDLTRMTVQTAFGPAVVARYTYNAEHRPLTYTDAAGQTTTYTYNAAGQVTSATNPLGQTTTFQYDPLGRLIAAVNANGVTQESYTYDGFDRIATFTDSEGWTASYGYDAADRVTQIAYPDGTADTFTYTNLDLTQRKDRQGRIWKYAYDADRRPVSVTDPLAHATRYGYYENETLKSATDQNGHTTKWDIDVESRPIAKHYADGTETTYSYDGASRLSTVTDALGQTKRYGYMTDDRLAGITYANAVNPTPSVSFSYDSFFARVVSMTDGTGTTNYSYVPVGSLGALQLQQERTPLPGAAILYSYDALGRLAGRNVAGAPPETYRYDAIGRMNGHAGGLGPFAVSYLGQTHQMTRRQLAGTTFGTAWSYLPNTGDRRLASINNSGIRQYRLTTTPENLITGISETSGGEPLLSWTYTYDAAYRLRNAATSTGASFGYTLDPADNITGFTTNSGTTTAVYNGVNEQTSLGGQVLSYDADGNLISDGQLAYGWDAENRLIAITGTGVNVGFAYDGFNRRVAITRSGSTTFYLWCSEQICQSRNSGGAVVRDYYPEGELLPGNGTRLYYGPDQIGTPRDVVAASSLGRTVEAYDYDPFGNPITTPVNGTLTDFRYAGMLYQPDSGLYLTQYRIYDPRLGRWLNRDPLRERAGPNVFAYVHNEPINTFDPMGLGGGSGTSTGGSFGGGFGWNVNFNPFSPSATVNWGPGSTTVKGNPNTFDATTATKLNPQNYMLNQMFPHVAEYWSDVARLGSEMTAKAALANAIKNLDRNPCTPSWLINSLINAERALDNDINKLRNQINQLARQMVMENHGDPNMAAQIPPGGSFPLPP